MQSLRNPQTELEEAGLTCLCYLVVAIVPAMITVGLLGRKFTLNAVLLWIGLTIVFVVVIRWLLKRPIESYSEGAEDAFAGRPMQEEKRYLANHGREAWAAYCKGYQESQRLKTEGKP